MNYKYRVTLTWSKEDNSSLVDFPDFADEVKLLLNKLKLLIYKKKK